MKQAEVTEIMGTATLADMTRILRVAWKIAAEEGQTNDHRDAWAVGTYNFEDEVDWCDGNIWISVIYRNGKVITKHMLVPMTSFELKLREWEVKLGWYDWIGF